MGICNHAMKFFSRWYAQENLYILAIFILAVCLRFLYFDASYVIWDEAVYLLHGMYFGGAQVGYEELIIRPPLVPILASLIWRISPLHYLVLAKTLMILLNSLVIWPVYSLGKLISKPVGFLSALMFALFPLSILESRFVTTDHLSAALALGSISIFLHGVKNQYSSRIVPGSILATLSFLVKYRSLSLIVILTPSAIFLRNKRYYLFAAASCTLIFIPYFALNQKIFHSYWLPIYQAFQFMEASNPISLQFLAWLFSDTFGLLYLITGISGIGLILYKMLKTSSVEKFILGIVLFTFAFILIESILVLYRGVSKPPGTPWEPERFLILLSTFLLCFSGYTVYTLGSKFSRRYCFIITALLILLINSTLIPQIKRAYTPQVTMEGGLRTVVKSMGIYLKSKDIFEVTCYPKIILQEKMDQLPNSSVSILYSQDSKVELVGNCPALAFYSEKKVDIIYDEEYVRKYAKDYVVSFYPLLGYEIIAQTCSQNWCSYLQKVSVN
jgi:hypothetical protein